jgi:hypothetical protein
MANADTLRLNRVYQIPGARLLTRCSAVLSHPENLAEPYMDEYRGKLAAIGLHKLLLKNRLQKAAPDKYQLVLPCIVDSD